MVDRMVDMSVKIGAVTLKNPVMPASGCFSTDLAQVMDLNRLGALVAKTVSREFRAGNPPPRAAEVEGGCRGAARERGGDWRDRHPQCAQPRIRDGQ